MRLKTTLVGALTGALTLALAGTAGAHVTAAPGEGASDGFTTQTFSVGHGCEGSPTTALRIQVPPSVPTATPIVHPLWDVKTKEGKKDPIELHGEKITSGVSEIVYTAKDPLPEGRLAQFAVSMKLPAGEEGDVLYFPTVQECEKGAHRWIQIPAEGESGEELEEPAPTVVLTAAEGGHGGGAAKEEKESADTQPVSNTVQTAAVDADDDEGAPVWLAVAALALGAIGLIAGIGGLMAGRRRSA